MFSRAFPSAALKSNINTTVRAFSGSTIRMADLVPPFTKETAEKKVKIAQDLWNTQY
jgi:hypothetical protein